MTPPEIVIAIDQGSHGTRAIAFDRQGAMLAASERPIATHDAGVMVEHDAHEIVASVRGCVDEVVASLDAPAGTQVHCALATQRSTIVCWQRETLTPLVPAISWRDRRASALIDSLSEYADEVRSLTGLRLSPHYGASKLRWCLDNVPAVAAAAADGSLAFGPLASYLVASITRERQSLVDPANASRTLLYSPASGTWVPKLLQLFGIEARWLPQPVSTAWSFGTLSAAGRQLPLTVVTGDQSAVPYAFGALDYDTVYINIGTGAFIQKPVENPVPPPLLTSVIHADANGRRYVMEGAVNGAGSALNWLAEEQHVDVAACLLQLNADALAHIAPPLFINTVGGLGSPWWCEGGEPWFSGAGVDDVLRLAAVLESIAFMIATNLDYIRQCGGAPSRLLVTGGVARSDYLVHALASVAAVAVMCPQVHEATARGTAWLAFAECAEFLPVAMTTVEPLPCPALASRYRQWQALMAKR
ncbi:MAG: hypothetical protein H6978_12070 [Gammaproteobacteria bacterium]|nr:hypothetical protein [Gammaproteobacteria bacterium]